MPQDAFTLRLNALELHQTLAGGRINKINQPAREEISVLIYTGKRTVKLSLNANASDCGVYFSEEESENPLVAPNFCMLLRKYIQGALITGVETAGFDPQTLESRKVPGLYACGEVLDIDGDCGGYNLQWAWSSGRLAGLSASKETEES